MPETNRHLELRTALYLILKREFSKQATIGSDQFVYYDPTSAKKRLAPNAFVKLGIPHKVFRMWKTWHHGAPDVAVEIVNDSDEKEEDWDELEQMLRLSRDREGRDLLLMPGEAEQVEARARVEEARARVEAEKARDALQAEVAELRRKLASLSPPDESK